MITGETSAPKVIWEQLRHHPSRQNSPAVCPSCAMPTADESTSILDLDHTDT